MSGTRSFTTSGCTSAARLRELRAVLDERNLDGFILPLSDDHLTEYVPLHFRRLSWLADFSGSTGLAVVLQDKAGLFVDSRYDEIARGEVDAAVWDVCRIPDTSLWDWMLRHISSDRRIIGYDPWLHARDWIESARRVGEQSGVELHAVETNPVDLIWHDRPLPPAELVTIQPLALTGEAHSKKLERAGSWLRHVGATALVNTTLDAIAWLLNLRGGDIPFIPVPAANLVIHADGTAEIFVDSSKVEPAVRELLGPNVTVSQPDRFIHALQGLGGGPIAVDPARTPDAVVTLIERAGARLHACSDPIMRMKAPKTAAEIAGHRSAQIMDGTAFCRLLADIAAAEPGMLTEITCIEKLMAYRSEYPSFRGPSFSPISGANANSAIIHYSPSRQTDQPLLAGSLYLVDSGAQYLEGTTDLARTVAIGFPSREMIDRFTRVLRGHIAIATAIFPCGTQGGQIDAFARRALWEAELDFPHGTGHGIGSYLCVHEAPQRIINPQSFAGGGDEPLLKGMILSNEPGFYQPGAYGIRIENLVVVESTDQEGEGHWLRFSTLSHVPVDRRLIDVSTLTAAELDWIDRYHAQTFELQRNRVPEPVRAWLRSATEPLRK